MTPGKSRLPPAVLVLALALAAVTLSACGGSSSTTDGAAELAHQHELVQARRQGAQAARQAARIKDLEREVHAVREDEQKRESQGRHQLAEPEPAPAAPAQTEPATDDWPGGSGYTAILASVSSEGEAGSIQTEATGKGLDAGVLFSSDYSSLRPGYWVVFSGVFRDADGAERRAGHAHELGYAEAYPRFVSP
jgi:hypothetical protein